MSLYTPRVHPQAALRRTQHSARLQDEQLRLGDRLALRLTQAVGTTVCAALFCLLALVSLPEVWQTHDVNQIVSWLSQDLIQLVLLPIIIVGQNLQDRVQDRQAEQTWRDAELLLHDNAELHNHLAAQDAWLHERLDALQDQLDALAAQRADQRR